MHLTKDSNTADAKFQAIAKHECDVNPALETIRIVIDEYLEEGRRRSAAARGLEHVADAEEPRLADLPVLLLVGGDDNIEAVLRLALFDIPHSFVWAREAADLAEVLKGGAPDVIVGETMSGRADGFRLLEAVKTSPGNADTPVILLNRESGLDSLYATYSAMNKAGQQKSVQ